MGFKLDKKKLTNLFFFIGVLLFLIPNTRGMIQIFLTRLIAFSPGVVDQEDQQQVASYDWKLQGIIKAQNLDFETTKGKVVLINFWATWCPPCIAEMPSLQELYNTYNDRVQFLFVSDEVEANLQKFMSDKNYDFPIHRSRSSVPEQLHTKTIPATYLIAKDGAIVIEKTGAADWNTSKVHATIDRLLAE